MIFLLASILLQSIIKRKYQIRLTIVKMSQYVFIKAKKFCSAINV